MHSPIKGTYFPCQRGIKKFLKHLSKIALSILGHRSVPRELSDYETKTISRFLFD
jgi:hypothetical protein